MSFAQGMAAEVDPIAMADEIVHRWAIDAAESATLNALFAKIEMGA